MQNPEAIPSNEARIIEYSGPVYHGGTSTPEAPLQIIAFPYPTLFTTRYVNDPAHPQFDDATLGFGLYATSDKERAERYARYRTQQHYKDKGTPAMITLTLDKYPLLDCRDPENPGTGNSEVPLDLALQWQAYLDTNKGDINWYTSNPNWVVQRQVDKYQRHLEDIVDDLSSGEQRTRPTFHSIQGFLGLHGSQPWGGLWGSFLEQAYGAKGLIALQDGETREWGPASTIVLYHLDDEILANQKITTLDSHPTGTSM